MSRKRMLSPDIWTDEGFLELDPMARLLFIGLISHADDEGRGCASPRALKAKVFPADQVSDDDIGAMCERMGKLMRVRFYDFGDSRYYQLDRWESHQFIKDKKASNIPEPDAGPVPVGGRTDAGPTPDRERTDAGPGAAPNERKKEKKEKKETAPRRVYAPSVELSEEEHAKLVAEFGASLTSECVQFLSDYKADKPYRNKSDYLTIRRWVVQAVRDRDKKAGKSGASPPGAVVFKGRTCAKCGTVNMHSGSMCTKCDEDLPRRAV